MIKKDILVIGGGFSGLTAALELSRRMPNSLITLVDYPIHPKEQELGGFAKFSGAKFALLPAGSGLIDVAGSKQLLETKIRDVVNLLGLSQFRLEVSSDIENATENNEFTHRSYDSYVLSPEDITALLNRLERQIATKCQIIRRNVVSLEKRAEKIIAKLDNGLELKSDYLFYAGGRKGSSLLECIPLKKQNGKGIDLGFRVEFRNSLGLKKLRSYGPDTKILWKNSRTFCLNHPGEIYWYEHNGIKIPGGVVAFQSCNNSNVGVLTRRRDKAYHLNKLEQFFKDPSKKQSFDINSKGDFYEFCSDLRVTFGDSVTEELIGFYDYLEHSEMINWTSSHTLHYPLIDWHWDSYCLPRSFKTSEPRLYCLGDLSGHARGLLQAAVSGLLAVEELFDELQYSKSV